MPDPDSTTYTGAIETAEEFGKRIYLEAWNRGWSRAEMKVVMGDGAEWIWNLAEPYFPGAVQIVDLYHARQHLWELARKLYPNDDVNQKAWIKAHQRRLLDKGKIEKLVVSLRSIVSTNPEVIEEICTEADYFERNAERMRYPQFRRQHLFVGSGVIEAGCKTVIGSRLKGDKRRTIGLHFQAAQAIAEYIEKAGVISGPLFRPRLNSRSQKLESSAMSPWTLWRAVVHRRECKSFACDLNQENG
jgi:hypothetical protein